MLFWNFNVLHFRHFRFYRMTSGENEGGFDLHFWSTLCLCFWLKPVNLVYVGRKRQKLWKIASILASHVNEIIFISGEQFDQCEHFSWYTDVFTSALQLSDPCLKLSNDHSGRYKTILWLKKWLFWPFGRVKGGDKVPLFALCPKNVSRIFFIAPKVRAVCKNSGSSNGWFSRSISYRT